ncbi:MAG: MFS transporter [Clostridiales bacterium]|jgi:MFS family permease|nr:MFS transporter [Clostridiales bacterium]
MQGEISSYRVLRSQPEYIKLIAANLINRFGDSIDAIAFSLMMYEITNSASLVALILGLNYIPTVLLQPLAGALVERLSKKRTMIAFDLVRGAIVAAVVWLYRAGSLTPGLLIVMTLLISTAESFRVPAGVAIVPMLLKEECYKVGVALNQAVGRATELVGFAAAGGIILLVGRGGALLIDVATFALSAAVIAFIRLEETVTRGRADFRNVLSDFAKGLRLVREHRVLIALLFVAALINFSTVPLQTFSVPYVTDWLHGDASVLSAMQFLVVAGTGIGSVICPKLTRIRRNTQIVAFGLLQSAALLLFGLAVLARDLESRRIVALVACLMFGLSSGVINVVFAAALMRNVPKEYMARLSGISNAVMTSAIPAGSFLCSALAAFVKVPVAIAASAALSFVLFLGIAGIKTLKNL